MKQPDYRSRPDRWNYCYTPSIKMLNIFKVHFIDLASARQMGASAEFCTTFHTKASIECNQKPVAMEQLNGMSKVVHWTYCLFGLWSAEILRATFIPIFTLHVEPSKQNLVLFASNNNKVNKVLPWVGGMQCAILLLLLVLRQNIHQQLAISGNSESTCRSNIYKYRVEMLWMSLHEGIIHHRN